MGEVCGAVAAINVNLIEPTHTDRLPTASPGMTSDPSHWGSICRMSLGVNVRLLYTFH